MRRFFALLGVLLVLGMAVPALASPADQADNCYNVTQISSFECYGLIDLYNSMNGPGWTNHTGWATTNTPCSWYGVTCADNGTGSLYVEKLSLPNNHLSGSFPLGISFLDNLTHLYLNNNQLSGTLPPVLADISNLQYLDLSNNQLSGSIPPEIGNFNCMLLLDLSNNQLSGNIPSKLDKFGCTWVLDLSNNRLSGSIPLGISNLAGLQNLYLSNNQLSGTIPAALVNLTNLAETDLGYNRLTASGPTLLAFLAAKDPDWAATQTLPPGNVQVNGRTLTWTPILYTGDGGHYVISFAETQGGPYTLVTQVLGKNASSYNAGGLNLAYNTTYYFVVQSYTPAHGTQQNNLLSDYSQAVSITTGNPPAVDCNSVTEIPVTECQALMSLYTSTNGPGWANHTNWGTATTPCSWLGVSCSGGHVTTLTLYNNQLSGSLPPELGNLANVAWLDLSGNQLSGGLPPQLGNLTKLERLFLHNNQLSGSLPPEIGSLASLQILSLYNNQLSGSIPPQLSTLTNLAYAELGYNRLTASDPTLLVFLATKDPDWAATQTVPPANVHAAGAVLTWTPIPYLADGGYYIISYATTSGGPYTIIGQTADKTVSSFTLPGQHYFYYLVVQSYTPAHGTQPNNLLSDYSPEIPYIISPPNVGPERGYYATTTPTLTWNPVSWAAGYEIQVATDKTFPAVIYTKNDLTAGDLSATVNATPPLNNGVYYWRVRALRANGSAGAWSAIDSFVVDVAP